jgi:hypothetical protein
MIACLQVAASLLLVGAGAAKLRNPTQAVAMVRGMWRTAPGGELGRSLMRAIAAGEIAVGAWAIATGSRLAAALLGACYFGFLVVAAGLLRRGQRGSCGCFGAAESPVGFGHVVVNIAGIGTAVAAMAHPPGPVDGMFAPGALVGVIAVAQSVLLAYLAFLSITALPSLVAARRRLLEVS